MKKLYKCLLYAVIGFSIFYIMFTFHYFFYTIDLLTHEKPCIGIGQYCAYYTDTEHCYVGSDYVLCDVIGDGIGYD